MSKANTYTLTGKGSVTFQDQDEKVVSYSKGAQVSAKELKAVPKRQQAFFEKVDTPESPEGDLVEAVNDEFTVDELKEALDHADVAYKSDVRKDVLIALYIEHIFEADEVEG